MGSLINASALSSDHGDAVEDVAAGAGIGVGRGGQLDDARRRDPLEHVEGEAGPHVVRLVHDRHGRWIISRLAKEYLTWPGSGPSPNRSRSDRVVFNRVKWLSSASLCA